MKKYYYAGAARIAVREGSADPVFLLGDHLGSTRVAVDYDGLPPREAAQLYKAWGETRFTQGSLPTDYQYTGQQHVPSIGLYYYGARWYDPALGRFVQADTVIPDDSTPLGYDRYAYVAINPITLVDPGGHCWV